MKRSWPHPRIIGHRGGGSLAPENTLAGFRKASAMGFGAVEFDVMLTADGIPILIHDERTRRRVVASLRQDRGSGRRSVVRSAAPRGTRAAIRGRGQALRRAGAM